jgi:SAM-dependent methyltransferase
MSDVNEASCPSAASHWDAVYAAKPIAAVDPDHPVLQAALRHFGDVRGMRVCDLGSGTGEYALALHRAGANVTAIDMSESATERLRRHVEAEGLVGLRVIRSNAMDVAEHGPFDCLFGAYILHHLEPFESATAALRDAVVPGGKAFFVENNAGIGAPALWFRRWLAGRFWFPKYGDHEEHPLTPSEVEQLRVGFELEVHHPELALFRLVSLYVLRHRVAPGFFAWLDEVGYAAPALRRFSYVQHLLLTREVR